MTIKKITLKELAKITKSTIIGDKSHIITSINSLSEASFFDISFLANARYEEAMKNSNAGAICIDKKTKIIPNKNFLVSDDPSRTFQIIAELILQSTYESAFKNIHPSAVIHSSAKIEKDVIIAPHVVVDQNVVIKKGSHIYPNTYIAASVEIGEECTIYSNVTIREGSKIGNRVVIQPGAVIGSCGFGFNVDKYGNFIKLKQLGSVLIEDDVEIGANTTIDRARFNKTIIKKGSKIDNLVQIAHNVEIGKNNAIAAQTGISGSSKTGNNCMMGGQVGVAGHLNLSDGVKISAQSGVSKNLKAGSYRGHPAISIIQWNKEHVYLRQLKKYLNKIKDLEDKISKIENI